MRFYSYYATNLAPPAVVPCHMPRSPGITRRFCSTAGGRRVGKAVGVSERACHRQLTAASRRLRPIRPHISRRASCSIPLNIGKLSKFFGTMPQRTSFAAKYVDRPPGESPASPVVFSTSKVTVTTVPMARSAQKHPAVHVPFAGVVVPQLLLSPYVSFQ